MGRRRKAPATTTERQMHVVLSDQHVPHQDPDAEALTLHFLREHQPDVVHVLGDLLDFYSLSRFDRDPDRLGTLQHDLDMATSYLEAVRDAAPNARVIYSEGNHEHRLRRYLWGQAKELASLRSLELCQLLSLERLRIEWVDQMSPYRVGKLLFTHGQNVRGYSAYTARANVERYGTNVICGHTHRVGAFFRRTYGSVAAGWENGCLCSLDPEYAIAPDWQQAFSVVWFHGSLFDVEQVLIHDGRFVYHGDLYEVEKS